MSKLRLLVFVTHPTDAHVLDHPLAQRAHRNHAIDTAVYAAWLSVSVGSGTQCHGSNSSSRLIL